MYLIILFAVIGAVIAVRYEFDEWGWDPILFIQSLFGIVFGGLLGVVVALCLPMHYQTDRWSVNLESLQDNSQTHGHFFLGSGSIEGKMMYVFYVQQEDSTFRLYQVDYSDASIKYSTNSPKEHITWTHPKENLWNKFALDIMPDEYTYVFEVPKGSIQNNYSLDAQ